MKRDDEKGSQSPRMARGGGRGGSSNITCDTMLVIVGSLFMSQMPKNCGLDSSTGLFELSAFSTGENLF
jgi:hypothetical protein